MKAVWLGLAAALWVTAGAAQPAYRLVKTIDLPGDAGGHGDWTLFDQDTRTVWLAQTPDHDVVVLDAIALTVTRVIPGIVDGSNIALTPDYAVLADNAGGRMVVVDKRSFATVAELHPEAARSTRSVYDDADATLIVATGGGDALVLDAKRPFALRSRTRLIPDPASPGPDVGLYVPSLGLVYQPVDSVVDVIEPATGRIAAVWRPDVQGRVKPMVYDAQTRRFLVGTTERKMLVMNEAGAVLGSIPVAGAVDETAIDEGLRRAYVGDKAGRIEIIDLDRLVVTGSLPSEPDVHTLAVDPASHRVFVYRNVSNKVDVFEPAPQ